MLSCGGVVITGELSVRDLLQLSHAGRPEQRGWLDKTVAESLSCHHRSLGFEMLRDSITKKYALHNGRSALRSTLAVLVCSDYHHVKYNSLIKVIKSWNLI